MPAVCAGRWCNAEIHNCTSAGEHLTTAADAADWKLLLSDSNKTYKGVHRSALAAEKSHHDDSERTTLAGHGNLEFHKLDDLQKSVRWLGAQLCAALFKWLHWRWDHGMSHYTLEVVHVIDIVFCCPVVVL